LLAFEHQYWNRGITRLAGVDEAGRGPLAGPVVAAAVVMEPGFAAGEEHGILEGLTDSKQLSEPRRRRFFEILTMSPHVETAVGMADAGEIDRINILNATHLAMARAVAGLRPLPQHVLVDGLPVKGLPCESTAIVGGDGKSLLVAAASIVAKVTRDALLRELDQEFPEYGFAEHKGYGTRRHIRALLEHGPTPIHRRSFRPVRDAEDIRFRSGTPAP
jgi:ribonuclease HII